jgi:hypothetical protein
VDTVPPLWAVTMFLSRKYPYLKRCHCQERGQASLSLGECRAARSVWRRCWSQKLVQRSRKGLTAGGSGEGTDELDTVV